MSRTSSMPSMRTLRYAVPATALAAAAIFSVACSSDDDTTPTATATATATETASSTATASPTSTGTGTATPTETGTATATSTPDDGGEAPGEPTVQDAVDTLDAYFQAVDAGDYEAAYALWGDDGNASGQTFDEFKAGYADTESVSVEIGEPGRVDPAAGSRYIEIPVEITATLTSGAEQHFEGSYVLSRNVIEGGNPDWTLYSADVSEAS